MKRPRQTGRPPWPPLSCSREQMSMDLEKAFDCAGLTPARWPTGWAETWAQSLFVGPTALHNIRQAQGVTCHHFCLHLNKQQRQEDSGRTRDHLVSYFTKWALNGTIWTQMSDNREYKRRKWKVRCNDGHLVGRCGPGWVTSQGDPCKQTLFSTTA